MRFGLALDFGSDRYSQDQLLERFLPLIALAEHYGFDAVFAGENYPTGPGRFHTPSPLLILAALGYGLYRAVVYLAQLPLAQWPQIALAVGGIPVVRGLISRLP
ncbi:MAG: LLM class flavin-dependent oxidoreductase [Chloroflexi bacterium]|nr:LLM class flavin-dependent oxidoreductase [Chloroflexota bacterium]